MMNIIRQFTPSTWDHNNQRELASYSEEYQQILLEVRQAVNYEEFRTRRVIRVQDVHAYGQFLIREQLLLNSGENQLYRVRRYLQVSRPYLNEVIKYNLDPRRVGMGSTLTFFKTLNNFDSNKLIVVVKALTTATSSNVINPSTSCDYYVEYIIEITN